MVKYQSPKIDYKKRRKSQTIPDQSLSIQEIVKKYVRGIPVDVVQRQGVYIDQSEHDLEQLSRMDFGEKAELAQALADEAERLRTAYAENQAKQREAQLRRTQEAGKGQQEAPKTDAGGPA